MSERLSRRSLRKPGVLVAVGTAAAILTGCTATSGEADNTQPSTINTYAELAPKRDAIAQLYDKCELVDAEPTKSNHSMYTEAKGYDALELTANISTNPVAETLRVEYKKNNDIIWGDQSVRLEQYHKTTSGAFQQSRPLTFRPAELPAHDTTGATFEMYPSKDVSEGTVFSVFVGNTAISRPYMEGDEVSAAIPCGSVGLDIKDGERIWRVLADGPELNPTGLEVTNHGPARADDLWMQ